MSYEITCKICRLNFISQTRRIYCAVCKEIQLQKIRSDCYYRRKLKQQRQLGGTDHCMICGVPYIIKGPLQKYCVNCRPLAVNKSHRDRYQQNPDIRLKKEIYAKQYHLAHPDATRAAARRSMEKIRKEELSADDPRAVAVSCKRCGKNYWARSTKNVYCKECRRSAKNESARRNYRINGDKIK